MLKAQWGFWALMTLMSALTLLVAGCGGDSGAPLPTDSAVPDAADPFVQNARLGRGINLGNALEAPQEGEWGVTLQEEYFQLIQIAGFDSVRIPIRWSAHAAESAPYTISPAFFERVDWAIEQSLSRGLLTVINVHHYEEIVQNPAVHEERLLAMWEQIAERYEDYPADLLFEVLNEPSGQLRSGAWNQLLAKAISVIRETNPDRNIIIGPANWNNLDALGSLELPDDGHIIVTIHYYSPFDFTHQGAEWVSGSDDWLGTTWQGASAERAVAADLDRVAAWAEANDRPIYLGEFGAYSKADVDSRARWTAHVARQAEERSMSWAYWEFCSGFGVFDLGTGRWNEQIRDALLPSS
jgi:endoglucanase